MKKVIAAFLSSVMLAGLLIGSVSAAGKPLPKPLRGVTGIVTTEATEIHAGDSVTFTATTNAEWSGLQLQCFQEGNVVINGGVRFHPAGTYSATFTISSGAYQNNPIGAECSVAVAAWLGYEKNYTGYYLVPEALRFTLLP